ncbi:MAG: 4-hydroxy-tetrahydrodipicolinate synthase [Alphaproteobacteria bacterium]|nr:4-hydroxy-tetrahydrodipicolinate synthase [Alphaproteobacteria bacterium]
MFKGSITALITPFKNNEIDWRAFENLVEWQIEQGVHGLVPCGTTGESPTLSHDEHMSIIERCVAVVNKRIPVIAGTGSNSTSEAIELTQHAKDIGADAALIVTPYYNKPTQDGMIAHFTAIHNAVSVPIVIYNIPGRCVVDMTPTTMGKLAKLPNIIGVKDASNDLARPLETARECGPDFIQLSGDDVTAAAFLAQGGHGVISVVSNIAPALSAGMQNAWQSCDLQTFALLRDKLGPLGKNLFCESNPAPLKYAASRLGLCRDEVRLPLLPASLSAREKVDEALQYAGLSDSAGKIEMALR